jgi:hypothetical protein
MLYSIFNCGAVRGLPLAVTMVLGTGRGKHIPCRDFQETSDVAFSGVHISHKKTQHTGVMAWLHVTCPGPGNTHFI